MFSLCLVLQEAVVNGRYSTLTYIQKGFFFVCVCSGVCISITLLRFTETNLCVGSVMLLETLSLCHRFVAFGKRWFYSMGAKRL